MLAEQFNVIQKYISLRLMGLILKAKSRFRIESPPAMKNMYTLRIPSDRMARLDKS